MGRSGDPDIIDGDRSYLGQGLRLSRLLTRRDVRIEIRPPRILNSVEEVLVSDAPSCDFIFIIRL